MPPNIMIRIGADDAGAQRALTNTEQHLNDVQTRGQRMGGAIRKATLPALAVLGGLAIAAKGAAEAAAEDEAGQVKLAGALERTTGATDAQVKSAEDFIAKLSRATGVTDDQMRPALAKLASATGDVNKAQDQLKLALDISAASGKDLSVVSKALAAADDGHTAALGKLVPGLDAATLKSKDMAAITDELSAKVGGAAADAANTATGRYRIMQVQMGELQEQLGTALIPVISALSAVLLKATDFASEHTTAIKAVVVVVAALAAGILVANVALKAYEAAQVAAKVATAAWTAAQWLLNAALEANPIGIVVVAIGALAAGIVLAYKHSETFRDAVAAVWAVLKNLNPIEAAKTAYDALAAAVSAVSGWISTFTGAINGALGSVGGLRGALSLLWKIMGFTNPVAALIQHFDSIRGAADSVIDAIRSVIGWISHIHWPDPPSWLGHLPGVGGLFGAAPPGAPALRSATSARSSSSRPRGASVAGTIAGSPGGITINVFGATDPEGTARAIKRALRAHDRRQGALSLLANASGA